MEMMKENKKKIIIGVIVIIIAIVLILIVGFLLKGKEIKKDEESGYKSNTNSEFIKDQKIGDFEFTNTSLNYKDGNSVLRVSVTNTSSQELNLQEFKIHVYDSEHNEIVTLTGFIGDKLQAGETKYIESSYADDLTSAHSIEYEIVE